MNIPMIFIRKLFIFNMKVRIESRILYECGRYSYKQIGRDFEIGRLVFGYAGNDEFFWSELHHCYVGGLFRFIRYESKRPYGRVKCCPHNRVKSGHSRVHSTGPCLGKCCLKVGR